MSGIEWVLPGIFIFCFVAWIVSRPRAKARLAVFYREGNGALVGAIKVQESLLTDENLALAKELAAKAIEASASGDFALEEYETKAVIDDLDSFYKRQGETWFRFLSDGSQGPSPHPSIACGSPTTIWRALPRFALRSRGLLQRLGQMRST